MTRIFVSYRRADTGPIAGRIFDRLVTAFGSDSIFKDTHDIRPGQDFRGRIREAVSQADIVLVLIGKQWVKVKSSGGGRRLDDPNDWVRIEVETGLQRDSAIVIPVLVDGASMPSANLLPDSLRELAFKNAAVVRNDPDFNTDMQRLIAALGGVVPAASMSATPPPAPAGSQQIGGSGNVQINVDRMTGGSITGKQTNYGTPLPISPRPQDTPLPAAAGSASRRTINLKAIGGALVVVLGLVFAFLALYPEQARTDWFRSLGLLPALPTNTVAPTLAPSETSVLSATPVPPTDTTMPPSPAPTSASIVPTTAPTLLPTPVTTSGLAIGLQAEVRGSNETDGYQNLRTGITRDDSVIQQVPARTVVTIIDGPLASEDRIWWKVRTPDGVEGWTIESSATRQTLMPIERTTAALRLIADAETLTLVVMSAQPVNLNGLEFITIMDDGARRVDEMTRGFSILTLTGGIAEPGSCFVYRLYDAMMPLPGACKQPNRIFLHEVPRADVFWNDSVTNRQRDVAVYQNGSLMTLCSAAVPECAISWSEGAGAPAPTTASAASGYPCAASITTARGNPIKQLRRDSVNDRTRYDIEAGRAILLLGAPAGLISDQVYRIADAVTQQPLGWIGVEYVSVSPACPLLP